MVMNDLNEQIRELLTSFANGACRLVENEADVLEDHLESFRSQLQIVCFLFEDLMVFIQTEAHSFLQGTRTGSILFALA